MYTAKLSRLIEVISRSGDANATDDIKLVKEVYIKSSDYVSAVMMTETARMADKHLFDEAQRYQENFMDLDTKRSTCHNAAMNQFKMVNRLCGMYNVEPVFSESDLSLERAKFADQLIFPIVEELFKERVR